MNSLNLLLVIGEENVAHHITGTDAVYMVRRGAVAKFLEDALLSAEDDLSDLTSKKEQKGSKMLLNYFCNLLLRHPTSA